MSQVKTLEVWDFLLRKVKNESVIPKTIFISIGATITAAIEEPFFRSIKLSAEKRLIFAIQVIYCVKSTAMKSVPFIFSVRK